MDPDKAMQDILTDWQVWRNPSTPSRAANLSALTILEHSSDLHDWIGNGGFLPKDYDLLASILDEVEEWFKGAGPCDLGDECSSDHCTDAWNEDKIAEYRASAE